MVNLLDRLFKTNQFCWHIGDNNLPTHETFSFCKPRMFLFQTNENCTKRIVSNEETFIFIAYVNFSSFFHFCIQQVYGYIQLVSFH